MNQESRTRHEVRTGESTGRVGNIELLKIIFRHGGPWERHLVLVIFGTLALVVVVLVIGELIRWPFEALMSYTLAVASIGAYRDAFNDPIYSVRILKEAYRQGRLQPREVYYSELIRYLEFAGEDGTPPGSRRWALVNYLVYCAMLGVSVAFAFAMVPLIGPWTPYLFAGIDATVAGSFFVANRKRVRSLLEEADHRGFRLSELSREVRR